MKRLLRFKHLVIAVVALCTALTAQTARAWDGSGTEASPYLIKNTADLDLLAHRVNGTHGETANEYVGTYFRLEADIAYDHTGLGDTDSNYEAIGGNGDHSQYFQGIFDGQNHVVSGIRIYKGGNRYQGLFGLIGYTAEVKNVILADAVITGYNRTGSIVGYIGGGTVSDCHALATVTVHTVHNNVWQHGGIAGDNDGTVIRCTSAAALTTADGISSVCVGVIVGDNEGTVTHCIYLGTTLEGTTRVGAIAGQNDKGTVQTCYYTNTAIQGKDDATTFILF